MSRPGPSPLSIAAEDGDEATAKHLLQQGANLEAVNSSSETALMTAADRGHAAVVQLLLENGAANEAFRTFDLRAPLHFAGSHGHEAVVELLLARGARIEVGDENL